MANVVITGARGFVGGGCLRALMARGHEVRAFVRCPVGSGEFRFEMPSVIDEGALDGAETVIHCAHAFDLPAANETATLRLRDLCRARGVRLVFVSSLAAHDAAMSNYGCEKWRIEQALDPARDAIVKPGTVLGDGGVFAHTRALCQRMPVLPLFYGGDRLLQTVLLDDLVRVIVGIVEQGDTGEWVVADDGVPLADFFRGVAALDGRRPRLVSLPGDVILPFIRLCERLGVTVPVTSDSLLGLRQLRWMRPNVAVRPFCEALTELSNEHCLISRFPNGEPK